MQEGWGASGQHLQAQALLQVWRDESSLIGFVDNISFLCLAFQKLQFHCKLLTFLIAGGFGFGAAHASTGAGAGVERCFDGNICTIFLHFQKFRVECKILLTRRTLLQEGSALGQVGQHLQAQALLQVRREGSLIGFDRLC